MKAISKKIQKFICSSIAVFIILSSFLNIPVAYAETNVRGVISYNGNVFVRTTPSNTSDSNKLILNGYYVKLSLGYELTILNYESPIKDNNNYNWYYIKFNYNGGTYNGYIRGDLISVKPLAFNSEPQNDYEKELQAKGFPYIYWPYLSLLHITHPNWQFNVLTTNLNWNDVVHAESTALGKSLIQTTNDGWKNLASYDYASNTFSTNYRGGGSTWYAASSSIVSYYLDPRNFLTESGIFMFEKTSFDHVNHTLAGVQGILQGTFMENGSITKNDGTSVTYAQAFMEAADASGASPYFLASRVIQEIGRTDPSSIISGTVTGYEGFYNYYNIHASGSTATETIANGLAYAQSHGWNSRYDAIVGGAQWIANGYINAGHDSLYTQKWDIIGPEYYSNQYMQNIQAPSSETVNVYAGYLDIGIIDAGFIFNIPVYNNMPADAVSLPSKNNPIPYLSSLSVNGNNLPTFNYANENYEYSVSLGTTNVTLGGTLKYSGASASGLGIVNLTGDSTIANVVVTAANGETKTYRVNIIKSAAVNANLGEVIDNLGIKYNSTFIWGIETGTPLDNFINTVKTVNGNTNVVVTGSNGTTKTNPTLATGDKVTLSINNESKTYYTVVYGDVSGDGNITVLDLLKVQKHILGSSKFSESSSYFTAADVSKDSNVTVLDLLKIQKHILGSTKISQS
jgi:beta-N-acetylglucosaminidase